MTISRRKLQTLALSMTSGIALAAGMGSSSYADGGRGGETAPAVPALTVRVVRACA